jgi:anion-transporting  ArsA/GET3 family ATPase
VEKRPNQPVPVDITGLDAAPGGSLAALMLDARATFDAVVERFARDPATRDRILGNPYYQRASASLSGSHEYMAMEKLLEVSGGADWDLVVLDTPPTRNALDFLDAPRRLVDVLDAGALRWLGQDDGWSPARAGLRLFGRGREALFSIFERFTGSEVVLGIAEFVGAFAGLLDGFRARAADVLEMLRNDDTGFLLVAAPNRVALSEALYFHDRLRGSGVRFRGFVVNRGRPGLSAEVPRTPWEAGFAPDGDPARVRTLLAAWQVHRAAARQAAVDHHHIEALRAHCGPEMPYLEIPDQEGDLCTLPALAALRPLILGAAAAATRSTDPRPR